VRLGRFRREPCGFLQLGNRLLDPPFPSERDSQIQVRPTQGRIQFNGLTKLPDAAFEVTLLSQQLTEVAVRFGVVGIETDGFLEVRLGQIKSTARRVKIPQIKMDDARIWLQLNG